MLATLLVALASQSQPVVQEIQARIHGTPFVVSLDLAGWKEQPRYPERLDDKLLFSGTMQPAGSILSVIVEANDPPASSQTWRTRLGHPGDRDELFEVQFTSCVGATHEAPYGVYSDYHAYFVTRTHVLDVHVSRMAEDPAGGFPRCEFERIVESLRVMLLRRGWREDYPASLPVPMTIAAALGVESKEWKEGHFARNGTEWPANFVQAEFLHYLGAPVEQQLAAYDKALGLVAKIEAGDEWTRFATAMLHEGRSLALYDAKRFEDSIAPLEQGLAILTDLGRKERAALSYNLACSHSLAGHREQALVALKQALDVDPRYREAAKKDADFSSLAADAEFRKLLEAPAPSAPAGKG